MNIHEYQAKQLLAKYGVAVPFEIPAKSLAEVRPAAEKIAASGSSRVVVKSQIHAGGRGKGTFKTGFQGGVKLASSVDEAVSFAEKMLGNVLVTKQTGHDGRMVQTLLLAAGAKIKKEFYLAVLLNRETSRPLIMASTEGGMDIDEVADKHPEKIFKESIYQIGLKKSFISPCCSTARRPVRSSWRAPKAGWTSRKSPRSIPKRFLRNPLIPPSASCRFRRARLPPRSVSRAICSTPV